VYKVLDILFIVDPSDLGISVNSTNVQQHVSSVFCHFSDIQFAFTTSRAFCCRLEKAIKPDICVVQFDSNMMNCSNKNVGKC